MVREPAEPYDPELDPDAIDVAANRIRERVEALLSPSPTPRDELARAAGGPPAGVFAALVELSLAGKAALLPGGLAAKAFPEED
jgi:DNA processing protein